MVASKNTHPRAFAALKLEVMEKDNSLNPQGGVVTVIEGPTGKRGCTVARCRSCLMPAIASRQKSSNMPLGCIFVFHSVTEMSKICSLNVVLTFLTNRSGAEQ